MQIISSIPYKSHAETESWKFSANSASLHLCVKNQNQWDGNALVYVCGIEDLPGTLSQVREKIGALSPPKQLRATTATR